MAIRLQYNYGVKMGGSDATWKRDHEAMFKYLCRWINAGCPLSDDCPAANTKLHWKIVAETAVQCDLTTNSNLYTPCICMVDTGDIDVCGCWGGKNVARAFERLWATQLMDMGFFTKNYGPKSLQMKFVHVEADLSLASYMHVKNNIAKFSAESTCGDLEKSILCKVKIHLYGQNKAMRVDLKPGLVSFMVFAKDVLKNHSHLSFTEEYCENIMRAVLAALAPK